MHRLFVAWQFRVALFSDKFTLHAKCVIAYRHRIDPFLKKTAYAFISVAQPDARGRVILITRNSATSKFYTKTIVPNVAAFKLPVARVTVAVATDSENDGLWRL